MESPWNSTLTTVHWVDRRQNLGGVSFTLNSHDQCPDVLTYVQRLPRRVAVMESY